MTQVTRLAQALTGARPLEGIWRVAGDVNCNGRIDLTDLVQEVELYTKA